MATAPPHASTSRPAVLSVEGHDILFPTLPYDLHARADHSTADAQLQAFIDRATRTRDDGRKAVMRRVFGENYDAMRSLAGSIKQHTLDHLDHYIDVFTERATAAGTEVYFARGGDDANRICLDIARRNNCRLCIKSKSMVTEETLLVPELERIGVETVETDLGEFILQIDHDAPSHIVQPMIHKDRQSVGRAFESVLGVPYTDDPSRLTRIARDHLRSKYRRADLGISGANFLVAETGSVVIVTNEGNGRMCTSAPNVHVVFVGIEKLIPSLEHLSVFLKLLARSATSQHLSVYTHIMTGPKRRLEPDGPQQMHVIFVDHGRTEILKPETREMLRCIRCGACLNACPIYRKVGGHAYGAVYSGPIGALITPLFRGLANYKDLPHASSLCGACYEACPVKINIPKYLIQLRRDMISRRITGLSERLFYKLWSLSLRYPASFRMGQWAQKWMLRRRARSPQAGVKEDPYAARRWIEDVSGPVKAWTSQRDMPAPPARGFRHWWSEHQEERDHG